MKDKIALKKLKQLLAAPNFTSKEARDCGVSPAHLNYYIRRGEIERISRGLYRGARAPEMLNFQWGDLVSIVRGTQNGVVCLISALALYELTQEIPRQHWIAIKNTTSRHFNPMVKVIRMRNHVLGKTVIDIDGVVVPIFDRERTILDAFRYLSKETALKALKIGLEQPREKRIDINKLRTYAKKMKINIDPYLLALTV
jgi:predicted transcriptional regulator of viral defense system